MCPFRRIEAGTAGLGEKECCGGGAEDRPEETRATKAVSPEPQKPRLDLPVRSWWKAGVEEDQ